MKKFILLLALLLATPVHAQELKKAKIYAGGCSGIHSMIAPTASDVYRKRGGGLYLHNSGWDKLTKAQQLKLLQTFEGAPIGIEIGNTSINWPNRLKNGYINLGIKPHFVTVNVFMRKARKKGQKYGTPNVPTVKEWATIHANLAKVAPKETIIVPTFEFPNFGEHRHQLLTHRISQHTPFKQIVHKSKGFTLDIPPAVFLRREDNYKIWVIDALKYARTKRLTSILIISPDDSGTNFTKHTNEFLTTLYRHNALPTVIAVENYVWRSKDWPNRVGHQSINNTILGLANRLTLNPNYKK